MVKKIRLGLIGKTLGHSYSPVLFKSIFQESGADGEYNPYPLERIEELPRLIESQPALNGFNVTVPYKEAIITYLDEVSETSLATGSVNTVFIDHSKRGKNGEYSLIGHSTDGAGFIQSLRSVLHDINSALILGTGGASKAVSHALNKEGIAVTAVSRSKGGEFGEGIRVIGYEDINSTLLGNIQLIVNATPVGMWPDTDACPPFHMDLITGRHLCYDLIYNPPVTKFLQIAMERGAWGKNGFEMLRNQALESWKFWIDRI